MSNADWATLLKYVLVFVAGFGANSLIRALWNAYKRSKQGRTVRWINEAPRFIIFLAIIGSLLGAYNGRANAAYIDCQSQVNQQFLRDLQTRTDVAAQDRQAVDALVQSVAEVLQEPPSSTTQSQIGAAIAVYNSSRAENERMRPPLTATGTCSR